MKRALLFLTIATLHAGETKPLSGGGASETHGDITVERLRTPEGAEQVWLASSADPAKRQLLYTHRRRAEVLFSDDHSWLAINDHAGSGYSAVLLYRRKSDLEYEKVADLTAPAWRYFNQRHGLKETPFDHAHVAAACWVGADPPILMLRLTGHLSGPSGIVKHNRGWHCLYDIGTQAFSTNLDEINHKSIRL